MTTLNVTLFFVVILGTIAFCFFCYRDDFPFKENLKVSLTFGTIVLIQHVITTKKRTCSGSF